MKTPGKDLAGFRFFCGVRPSQVVKAVPLAEVAEEQVPAVEAEQEQVVEEPVPAEEPELVLVGGQSATTCRQPRLPEEVSACSAEQSADLPQYALHQYSHHPRPSASTSKSSC